MTTPMMVIAHHDDFDGCAAAALLAAAVSGFANGRLIVRYQPVDHDPDTDTAWRQATVCPVAKEPHDLFAIVDFPYHPTADIWLDHHATSFKTPEYLAHFQDRVRRGETGLQHSLLDPSCARTVYRHYAPYYASDLQRYLPLVEAADMIDQARYPSPQAVYEMALPALRINAVYRDLTAGQRVELIHRMRTQPDLSTADALVAPLVEALRPRHQHALSAYPRHLAYDRGVVTLDIAEASLPFLRYAPYLFYPESMYTVALYTFHGGYAVSLAQNPWRRPDNPVHLGSLAKDWGGGGHEYAAGISSKDLTTARLIAHRVATRLRDAA